MKRTARDLLSLSVRRMQAWGSLVSGVNHRRLARCTGCAAILMYHRILPDDLAINGIEPGMYVRASSFRKQLAWLTQRFRVRTLGQLIRHPPDPAGPPEVALTFDDGWRDNLTVGWPLMRDHDVRPTIFLVRDWVARGRNDEGKFLRPKDVAKLARQGVEFGAHTVTHPHLDRLSPNAVEMELRGSREAVSDWTGAPCELFAYPFGHYSESAVTHARRLFKASVRVGGGWWKPYGDSALIPRVGVHEDMTSTRSMLFARMMGQR